MPNWSSNSLTIQGKKSDIIAMFAKATPVFSKYDNAEVYTLQSFVPMPETYKAIDTTNSLSCFLSVKKRKMKDDNPNLSEEEINAMFDLVEAELTDQYNNAVIYQKETYGVVGWYDWNLQNLGTKWDATIITKEEVDAAIQECNDDDDDNGCIVFCVFDTAWTPPIAWLEKIVNDNPNLFFDMWTDEESGFKWFYEGVDGVLSDDMSDTIKEEVNNTISKIDHDEWVEEYGYDDETSQIFIDNFDDICMNFLDSGFWSRGSVEDWLDEFADYFADVWMSNYEFEED